MFSNNFFCRVTVHALSAPVPAHYDAGQVFAEDGVFRRINDRSQPGPEFSQLLGSSMMQFFIRPSACGR
jgi:hypothetical protein